MLNRRNWSVVCVSGALLASTLGISEVHAAMASASRIMAINGQVARFLNRHTKMSALVAEELPTVKTTVPLYVTANVDATSTSYSVQYWAMTQPEPINRRASTAFASQDTHLLTISGTEYPGRATLDNVILHLAPWYRSLAGKSLSIPLISGFDAHFFPQTRLLSWDEGDWTVEVEQGSKALDLAEGRQIIRALDRWALPPFPGVLIAAPAEASVSDTSIGDVYALAFADGSAVYQISPFYNHAPNASDSLRNVYGMDSPGDLVEAANSLVPTTSFYNPTVSRVTMKIDPSTVHAGQYAMISGQLLSQYGDGVPFSHFSMTGLPQSPSYINGTVNQNGRFSMRIFFPKPGTYIIGAGDGLAGQQLTVHVLKAISPAPRMSVIREALDAIAGKNTLPLDGPSTLPSRNAGYLTATAQALPSTDVVFVIDTTRPLGINSPLINSYLSPNPMVAQFSEARLQTTQPSSGSARYFQELARYNPLYVPAPTTAVEHQVTLGQGIAATVSQTPSKTLLDWREGDWTLEVEGGNLTREQEVAKPLVAYLHRAFLPPYPGIVAVQLVGSSTSALTHIDWVRGNVLSAVLDPTASTENPTLTAEMATHWGPE